MVSAVSILPGEDGECATDDSQLPQAFVSSPPYYPWGHAQQQPWEPKGEQKYNNKKESEEKHDFEDKFVSMMLSIYILSNTL